MAGSLDNVSHGYALAWNAMLDGSKKPEDYLKETMTGTGGAEDSPGTRAKQMGMRLAAKDFKALSA